MDDLEAAGISEHEYMREQLYDLWCQFGTCVESDSGEGWDLADAILKAGYRVDVNRG